MSIIISDAARERMQDVLGREPAALGIRFSVKPGGGCSGYDFAVELAHELGREDLVLECEGLKLVVDRREFQILDGTEIDFSKNVLKSSFVFRNPNLVGECGCGASVAAGENC